MQSSRDISKSQTYFTDVKRNCNVYKIETTFKTASTRKFKQYISCQSTYFLNPNPHTVPLIPNRYGKRGVCAGLSPSPTPSTRRPISHWWARWVSVACLGHVLRGGTGRAGGGGPGGGGCERRKCVSHPENRAYTHQILQFSYFLPGNEPIRGSHFSSFQHILPLKQYNGWISIKSIKTKIILY